MRSPEPDYSKDCTRSPRPPPLRSAPPSLRGDDRPDLWLLRRPMTQPAQSGCSTPSRRFAAASEGGIGGSFETPRLLNHAGLRDVAQQIAGRRGRLEELADEYL